MATPQPDPFSATTYWQLAFREAIDPQREFVVRRSPDGMVQFALHQNGGKPILGPMERRWLFGCNVLGREGFELFAALTEDANEASSAMPSRFVVSGLAPTSPVLASLRRWAEPRAELARFRAEVQCAASLDGGVDGFLSRRSGNLRRNLKRLSRSAIAAGVSFERAQPDRSAANTVFGRMLTVERSSWKGIRRCGMDQPDTSRFYSGMLERLSAHGAARVIFAMRDGADIGFIFGGVTGGIYRGQQFSFDQRHAPLSIGTLLQFEQICWLCEEGAWRYDLGPLLGADMAYKRHWTELHFPIEAWSIGLR